MWNSGRYAFKRNGFGPASLNVNGILICSGIKMRLKELLCKNFAFDIFYYSAVFENKTNYEREEKKVISNKGWFTF